MTRNVEIKRVTGSFIDQQGKTVNYDEIQLVVDGYMVVKLDKTKDNYKNLKNMIRNGDVLKVIPTEIK